MTTTYAYLVTGDHNRMVYSRHATETAARRAARRLARRWGWSHPGAEPQVVHDGRVLPPKRTWAPLSRWSERRTP